MTEERMICTLDPEVLGRNLFWKPVEPAPPKDWRPVCYSGWHGEPCGGRFIELGSRRIRPECEGCPYHKME